MQTGIIEGIEIVNKKDVLPDSNLDLERFLQIIQYEWECNHSDDAWYNFRKNASYNICSVNKKHLIWCEFIELEEQLLQKLESEWETVRYDINAWYNFLDNGKHYNYDDDIYSSHMQYEIWSDFVKSGCKDPYVKIRQNKKNN